MKSLRCQQPFDLILMDVQMPEMDGAIARIREAEKWATNSMWARASSFVLPTAKHSAIATTQNPLSLTSSSYTIPTFP
jgi:CheY-like chemotaxis protein